MQGGRAVADARRRATTRRRIVRAGTHLFETQGYAGTSITQIAGEAGVAARTVYLHFDSKASILLAYFDDWMDSFIDLVCSGPADETLAAAATRAYAALDAEGEVDNREFAEMAVPHPVIELFASSDLDIPGHVLQWWVRAQDRLAAHFRSRGSASDSIEPRIRAAAVFAAWMVTLLSYRDVREGTTTGTGPMHNIAIETLTRFDAGLANPTSRNARS